MSIGFNSCYGIYYNNRVYLMVYLHQEQAVYRNRLIELILADRLI